MKEKLDLLHGKPGKSLIFFAFPMIIGNLFQQFYNMTDSIIVGNFVGENALAAVGASYTLTTVYIMVAIGGSNGATVLTSQFFGAEKYREMKTSVYTFLMAFLALSLVLAVFGWICNPAIMRGLKTPDNIYADAVRYLQIYFAGLPFMFMYNVLAADFNALGRSRIPLVLLIFSSVLNIVLDLWFVIGFQMGVEGVAIATVIAQGVSAVVSFGILIRVLKGYQLEKKAALFDKDMLIRGTQVAVPSTVQQSIVSIGMLLSQSAVNKFGSSALAGFSVGSRLESICVVPMMAMGNAMTTFTAQNLGAKKVERVREGYRAAQKIILFFGICFIIMAIFFHDQAASIFVDRNEAPVAFEVGRDYFKLCGCFFSFLGFKVVTDGVLRGSGDKTVYMIANLVNLGIRVSVAQFVSPILGLAFVWYAVPLGWIANFVISYSWYRTGNWKKNRLV